MERIEFIGGSGVGKSTLYKEVVKMKSVEDRWMTVEEARIHLAKTVKADKNKLHKLFQAYLKMNIIKKFQGAMALRILNSYKNDIFDCMHEKYSDVADVFLDILYKNDKINSTQKVAFIAYYYKLLINEIMLFDYFQVNDLIVYHDGIIHNTSGFKNEEKSDIIFRNHVNYGTSIIPVGVIYCYMNMEKYIERRKGKIAQGKGTVLDKTSNSNKLEKLFHSSLKSSEDKIKILRNYNVQILELNMENSIECNAKKAYEFIKRFQ